jgi:hypothetical protein
MRAYHTQSHTYNTVGESGYSSHRRDLRLHQIWRVHIQSNHGRRSTRTQAKFSFHSETQHIVMYVHRSQSQSVRARIMAHTYQERFSHVILCTTRFCRHQRCYILDLCTKNICLICRRRATRWWWQRYVCVDVWYGSATRDAWQVRPGLRWSSEAVSELALWGPRYVRRKCLCKMHSQENASREAPDASQVKIETCGGRISNSVSRITF